MGFERWTPLEDLPGILYLEGLHDDCESFRLLLRGSTKEPILRITFDPALSYRNTHEGDLLKTITGAEDLEPWPLYTVTDSDYLAWFTAESLGIHETEHIVHYAIFTPMDCVDVLSPFPPVVEWV